MWRNMNAQKLFDVFVGTKLMMLPQRAVALLSRIQEAARVSPGFAADGVGSLPIRINGNDAVVSISGPLVHKGNALTRWFGMSSYDEIEAAFNMALENPDVERIVFDVDSPGGEVSGAFDLADAIASSSKPTIAYANDMAASAAYLLIAGVDQIVTSRTAQVGSIGVVSLHVSAYGANQAAGFEVREIASGNRKTEGSPNRPLDPAAEAAIRDDVESFAEMFYQHVAAHRGMLADDVRAQEAAVYLGSAAIDRGLVDSMGRYAARGKGGHQMPQELRAELQEPEVETVTQVEEPAVIDVEPEPEQIEEAQEEPTEDMFVAGVEAERTRVESIEAHTVPGHEAIARTARAEGWPLDRFLVEQTKAVMAAPAPKTKLADASVGCAVAQQTDVHETPTRESSDEEIRGYWDHNQSARAEYTTYESFRALVRRWGLN